MIKAENNGIFETRPGLTIKLIAAKIPKSEANIFGNLDQTQKYQIKNSTQLALDMGTDISIRKENTYSLFAAIGLVDTDTVKVFTDLTGRFPVTSNMGVQCMLILYAYDTNEILVKTIKTRNVIDMLHAYDVLYNTSENVGYTSKLNIMNNKASKALKKMLQKKE